MCKQKDATELSKQHKRKGTTRIGTKLHYQTTSGGLPAALYYYLKFTQGYFSNG
jgi:hypothetical protein